MSDAQFFSPPYVFVSGLVVVWVSVAFGKVPFDGESSLRFAGVGLVFIGTAALAELVLGDAPLQEILLFGSRVNIVIVGEVSLGYALLLNSFGRYIAYKLGVK